MYKRRSYKPKKKVVRRRRRAAVPRPLLSKGGFTVVRKVNSLFMANGSVSGVVLVRPSTANTILTAGSPIGNPIFSNTYTVPFSMQFQLSDLAQYLDLTAICDKYKITNVGVKIMYNVTATQGSSSTASFPSMMPIIKYVTDSDDASLNTVDQLDAKMGLKTKSLANGKIVKIRCKPRVAPLLYNGTSSGYEVPAKATWINAGYDAVPHYGIKGYFENLSLQDNTQATSCLTFELTYTVQCRDLQ